MYIHQNHCTKYTKRFSNPSSFVICDKKSWPVQSDEYANRIPNPEHMPEYTKVKVLHTQDKEPISWAT